MSAQYTKVGLAVFIFKDGRFLLFQRTGAHGAESWGLPGGHIEFGETFEQTAVRETKEETDLEIKDVRIIGATNDYFEVENKHYVTVWAVSNWSDGEPSIMEPEKCISMHWESFDTLPDNLFLPLENFMHSAFLQAAKEFAVTTN